jgi:hypothetical protein
VHAKVTLSSDRKYYREDVMMMIEKNRNDQWKWWSVFLSQSEKMFSFFFSISLLVFFEFFRAHYDHHFLSVSLKLLCDLSLKTVCNVRFHALLECFVSYYQSFFISVSLERSMSSSFVWASLRCLNYSSSFVARRYLNTLTINSKMFKRIIKFVSRLSAHIFSRRSSNFEHFNSVWCIVCFLASQKHLENLIVFILWR